MDEYQLIGTEVSLYSGKARAYLRYKGIPFKERLATLRTYRKVILPRTGVHYIPVIISPDDIAVQDTTDIIDFLEERFPEPSVYPETPRQRLAALLFEVYGDEWLLLPAMHYRWFYKRDNLYFILKEFGGTWMPFPPGPLRFLAGVPGAILFGGSVKRFIGVTKKNYKEVEEWYEEFLSHFNGHLKHHPFLFGSRPSIGDFGLMAPLYAHLYRDPYPGRLMRRIAPEACKWVERMNAPEPKSGEFLPDDQVPETLLPILQRMAAEHFPVLMDIIDTVGHWIEKNPGRRIPRFIGRHEFSIGGVTEERAIWTFSQWMFQRPLFYYQSLSPEERASADELLKAAGMYEGMQKRIEHPIKRVNNRLVPA